MKRKNLLSTIRKIMFAMFLLFISFMGCNKTDTPTPIDPELKESADVANAWYKLQLRFLLERNSTLNGVYFGHMGIGLYESVRHGILNAVSLSTLINQMPAMPDYDKTLTYNWTESANAAMASMLRSFNVGLTDANSSSIDSLEEVFNVKVKAVADAATFDRSQLYGRSIGKAINDWRLVDNLNTTNTGYVPPVGPGLWQATPTAFANPVNPFIGTSNTFLLIHSTTVSPAFTFAYSEDPNSDFYKMVKQVYDVNLALTQDQKNTALYWVDTGNGVGYTPPGHDFFIVMEAIEQTGVNLGIAAEAYAKGGIAERDATIVTFRSKYKYNLLRPVTFVQKLIQPGWLPFIPTPPHPEYPAAHAAVSGSVYQAAARVLGETKPVTDRIYEFRSFPARTYANLFAAGEEAGISRLYGGIHYQPSITAGLALAKIIGNNVGDIKIKP